jgi:hypothetical protein
MDVEGETEKKINEAVDALVSNLVKIGEIEKTV